MLRILLVDDFPLFRRGVKDFLAARFGTENIGEAGNVPEMFEAVRHKKWDVVVMDISMPGRTGPEALKELKRELPGLPVVVLTMHPEDQFAVRMFKAGADGYLTKSSVPEELVRAINKVLEGGQYVSPSVAEKLALTVKTGTDKPPHELLSDREYEIFRFIGSGKTVTEIAEALRLSVSTVSTHRAHILEKMNMKNNAELTRYAVQHGLVH